MHVHVLFSSLHSASMSKICTLNLAHCAIGRKPDSVNTFLRLQTYFEKCAWSKKLYYALNGRLRPLGALSTRFR